jgi:hypothetical protein
MILPHVIWMGTHLELISSKTMATLTTNQSSDWLFDVRTVFDALLASTLGSCAITLATFLPCFYRHFQTRSEHQTNSSSDEGLETTLLLERFLICITIVLCLLVLSGHALEFKNRWLQPFLVMVPAYFVLRLRNFFPFDRVVMNRVCAIGAALMFIIMTAVVTRPVIGRYRHKYCWLNMPYGELAWEISKQIGDEPAMIVAANMRIAGNLRLYFPETPIISKDQQYITDQIVGASGEAMSTKKLVIVTDDADLQEQDACVRFVRQSLHVPMRSCDDWRAVDVNYLYAPDDAHQQFFVGELAVERLAFQPRLTENQTR